MKKLRVGFLIDDLKPNQYVIELITSIANNENFDTPLIITGYKSNDSKTFIKKLINKVKKNPFLLLQSIARNLLLEIIKLIENRIISKKYPKFKTSVDLKALNTFEIEEVAGQWSESWSFLEFNNDDLSLISHQNLDCIVQCGSGILKGEILSSTKFGVITSSYEDSSGFWEVLNGEPSSMFVVKKLNQDLDNEEVLYSGSLMTSNIWLANNAQLLEKSNIFILQHLLNLAENKKLSKLDLKIKNQYKSYQFDSVPMLIKYILFIISPKILNSIVSKLLSPNVIRYSVAYAYHNEHSKPLERYSEILNPKGRFLADPFVFEHDDNNYIFVEDLFFNDNKGRISVIKIDGDNYEFQGEVIEEDFHLSFPFIFKDGNEIYLIPESHANLDIRLYRCIEFPHKWEFDQTLMKNVSAADTMILNKEGTWFMLTNICSAGSNDHQSELHIFYSDKLKSNSWNPIASGNPVIFNSLKARNGGLFNHENKIYRVNQAHGQAHYGKSFDINEILCLSKEEYKEKECLSVNANFKDEIISTHSFNANKKVAVVDFARHQRLSKALKT